MTGSDWIAVIGITATVIIAVLGYIIKQKDRRIELLETKNELLKDNNIDLKRQVDRLEVTGTLVNKFFSNLPAPNEVVRELKQ